MQKITPFLWFDNQAEEAVNFYASVFKDAKVGQMTRYTEGTHGQPGTVMTASFQLFGQDFTALNGGPHFKFNESISFVVNCESQDEVDYYWDNLISGGGQPSQCGWLKDKFGVSWQIVPTALGRLMSSGDKERGQRVMQALMKMTKLDVNVLQQAYDGK